MLIDIHAYVGHWPFRRLRGNTCRALLERMHAYGVDKAAVSNINGIFYKNTQSANEELYEEITSGTGYLSRLIPFAVINPTYTDWEYDLEICHRNLGMKGLRLYPQYHDYEITHPSCIEMVKMARDLHIPVSFSMRVIDTRQRSWLDTKKELNLNDICAVVTKVPDARYIILNTMIGSVSDDNVETIKSADIVFDTTRLIGVPVSLGGSAAYIPNIIEKYGSDKLAFGTATPFLDYVTPFLRIETLNTDEVDDTVKNLIRSGNAERILR